MCASFTWLAVTSPDFEQVAKGKVSLFDNFKVYLKHLWPTYVANSVPIQWQKHAVKTFLDWE